MATAMTRMDNGIVVGDGDSVTDDGDSKGDDMMDDDG